MKFVFCRFHYGVLPTPVLVSFSTQPWQNETSWKWHESAQPVWLKAHMGQSWFWYWKNCVLVSIFGQLIDKNSFYWDSNPLLDGLLDLKRSYEEKNLGQMSKKSSTNGKFFVKFLVLNINKENFRFWTKKISVFVANFFLSMPKNVRCKGTLLFWRNFVFWKTSEN